MIQSGVGRESIQAGNAPRSGQFPCAEHLQIVVPYTKHEVTAQVVTEAAKLTAGLDVVLKLVATYVAPYPTELRCPEGMRRHLTDRLMELTKRTSLPCSVQLVVCRDRADGFRQVLSPGSIVLLGSRKRIWRTREDHLARHLSKQGHHVSLLHFD